MNDLMQSFNLAEWSGPTIVALRVVLIALAAWVTAMASTARSA